MKHLKETADRILANVQRHGGDIDPAMIRDHCDIVTGGELSALELDILTEMVERRQSWILAKQDERSAAA